MPARTRFAPSPTGALHVGSVRTALFAWLAAHRAGGSFILRIEDTDQGRHVPGSEARIVESLRWLGLEWDEGPEVGGPHAPYVQSLRTELYREHAQLLAAAGAAYWCTCTPERLAQMREAQRAASQPTRYDRRCLERQDEVARERAAGGTAVLRQRMPDGTIEWDDVVRGWVSVDAADLDDSVLLKGDGFPTYHLAVVVDDHLMEVSDVIRAEEWIPSTPKHLALYSALGWEPPRFAHVPIVLDEHRLKLSKRRGARDILEYGEMGYVPAALINAMALLGWSSGTGQEVFTLDELRRSFSLDRVNPAPAIFDPRRLDDLNGIHIRRMPEEELIAALEFFLPGTSEAMRRSLVPLLGERMVRLDDARGLAAPLLGDVSPAPDVALPPRNVDAPTAIALLDATLHEVEAGALADPAGLRQRLTGLLEERGVKARDGFRVLYVAILGAPSGLPVFDVMALLGPEAASARLRAARDLLMSRTG